jgi:hypothetical protein
MLIFGRLKTTCGGTCLGWDKKTAKEITAKNNKNIIVIPIKNIICLCFGDIKTIAISASLKPKLKNQNSKIFYRLFVFGLYFWYLLFAF